MPMQNKNVPALLLWLLPLLMVSACATRSEPLPPPVVGEKPRLLPLPSAIAEIEPPPSGHYTKLLTDRRETSRQRLKSTPTRSAPSSGSSSTTGR